jgi:hypothetical protein
MVTKGKSFGGHWLMQVGHKMLVLSVICEWADEGRQEHHRGRAINLKAQWAGKLTSLLPVETSIQREPHRQKQRQYFSVRIFRCPTS